jgi:hypothetical protein
MHAPSQVIASIFGLSAFAVAVLSGLVAGSSATETLGRAIPVMLIFYFVGIVIGSRVESMAREATDRRDVSSGGGGKPVENPGVRSKDSV